MERSFAGRLSVAVNIIFGGERDQSLCGRWAEHFGSYCLACRIVGAVFKDPDHCLSELEWFRAAKTHRESKPNERSSS